MTEQSKCCHAQVEWKFIQGNDGQPRDWPYCKYCGNQCETEQHIHEFLPCDEWSKTCLCGATES